MSRTDESRTRGYGRVTRKDVARYAGVSTAVVSYTLNGGPKKVSPETTQKVLEAVAALGYRPNATARALTMGSTEMLGLVVPDSRNPFFAELCHSAEAVAAGHGRAVLIVNAEGGTDEVTRHVHSLASRQVDGLLIASYVPPSSAGMLSDLRLPTVVLNQFVAMDGLPTIGVDLEAGARLGLEHLVAHGHQDIAFVGGGDPEDRREAGWRAVLEEAGLRARPALRAEFSPVGGYRAAQQMLARGGRPTAVFVSSDYQAMGVLRACHEAGLSIPADVAVVSFDGTVESEFSCPALTTVRQPLREMVTEAIRQLVDDDAWSPGYRTYPAELVIRQSCGCPQGQQN